MEFKLKFNRNRNTCNVLIGSTGSVATIKLLELLEALNSAASQHHILLNIRVILTKAAQHFVDISKIPDDILWYTNEDEWTSWNKRSDPVLHIELRRWADLMLIAPLDANTLAKISGGLCDNLLTCVVRAWNIGKKPLFVAPSMNTAMWENPLTEKQLDVLRLTLHFKEIPVVAKILMCGDSGLGAMAEVQTIVKTLLPELQKISDVLADENL